ncbi:MAG: septation protein A [Rhizobiales bacterium]|nr:septation protein A [Hyphomicrobiales bacterium]
MIDKPADRPTHLHPGLKLALDLGPLLLFFFANARPHLFTPLIAPLLPAGMLEGAGSGIFAATAVFMIATLAAMAVSYALTRHLPMMTIVTAVVVTAFGAMTLVLHDETFIKLKPTIIYLLFAGVLGGGLLFRKPLLAMVFDAMFDLDQDGWRKLTVRWMCFFLVLAVLNEIVWRTQTPDTWVAFKTFASLPLTLVFAAAQLPLLQRHARAEAPQREDDA